MDDDRTPHTWLWDELVRLLGEQAALELHAAYTARQRQYNRDKRSTMIRPKPVQHRTQVKWRLQHEREVEHGH